MVNLVRNTKSRPNMMGYMELDEWGSHAWRWMELCRTDVMAEEDLEDVEDGIGDAVRLKAGVFSPQTCLYWFGGRSS